MAPNTHTAAGARPTQCARDTNNIAATLLTAILQILNPYAAPYASTSSIRKCSTLGPQHLLLLAHSHWRGQGRCSCSLTVAGCLSRTARPCVGNSKCCWLACTSACCSCSTFCWLHLLLTKSSLRCRSCRTCCCWLTCTGMIRFAVAAAQAAATSLTLACLDAAAAASCSAYCCWLTRTGIASPCCSCCTPPGSAIC
jgi:hypothetical protein